MASLSFPHDCLNVHLVSFGSLSAGLSLVRGNGQPEFANIACNTGSARISLLIAYLNFGPTRSAITANIIFESSMASASASSRCQP